MSRRCLGGLLLGAVVVLPMTGRAQVSSSARPPDTSAKAVIAKAAAYLRDYQQAWEFVLANEANVQEVVDANGLQVARREMSGDFFLSYVAGEGGWLSVRDVSVVDGVPVEDRGDLRRLLTRGGARRIGPQLADHNARYNLGSIERNFNDPMLALVILDQRHRGRFRFKHRYVEQREGVALVTVEFSERDRPTLVRGTDGRHIFATGELVIEAATGRFRKTTMVLSDTAVTARLTTSFAEHKELGLWLPASFTERYEGADSHDRQAVAVESTYSNYRRFDVNVIIR